MTRIKMHFAGTRHAKAPAEAAICVPFLECVQICVLFSGALWGPVGYAQHSVAKADYVVSRPVVNLYSAPTADGDVVSQSLYGTGVLALEKKPYQLLEKDLDAHPRKSDWVKIRTGDEYTGWVMATDLTELHGEYAPTVKQLRVADLSANVYREPSVTKHAPVLQLPWESLLEVIPGKVDEGGRWLQVRLVNGQTAYVQQGDVSTNSPLLSIDQTIELGRRFLGITYTWGGVSSFGFDCSGFTQMLLRQRGIFMPRDADVQAGWSGVEAVERKNLKAGDLLFFGDSATKITHTGMYIGDGEFIHDTVHAHPGVQISRLSDTPWTTLLVAARRIK